jgi:hypothetical protein
MSLQIPQSSQLNIHKESSHSMTEKPRGKSSFVEYIKIRSLKFGMALSDCTVLNCVPLCLVSVYRSGCTSGAKTVQRILFISAGIFVFTGHTNIGVYNCTEL